MNKMNQRINLKSCADFHLHVSLGGSKVKTFVEIFVYRRFYFFNEFNLIRTVFRAAE